MRDADLAGRADDAEVDGAGAVFIGRSRRRRRPRPRSESRSNAVWVAGTAASTCASSTITEIRISEVEIISMLVPALASAAKNFAVMPGCERMPAPISDTLPIWSS